MQNPKTILQTYWGYTDFKPQQEAIINSILEGNNTFALLPTGGGKSLCFQIPALIKPGICIVVSPLIALINDQVNQLKSKGIKAIALVGHLGFNELHIVLNNCIFGGYKFLYLSPERLENELVQNYIKKMNVNLIAVDEAHCISQWGNDFRPAYSNIAILQKLQPQINFAVLTASATPQVQSDIIANLNLNEPHIIKQSYYRKNLAYMVFNEVDKYYKMEQILKKNKASSIIYVRNRLLTKEITAILTSKNISATYYHGGLLTKEKTQNMKLWLTNQKQVMVATNAFGMGIDKPDVKTVIHINLPESIESYFQEAGRAGRNGNKAYAIILKNKSDEVQIKNQFLSILPSVDDVKLIYRKLSSYFRIAINDGCFETFDFSLNTFCNNYKLNPFVVHQTLLILERNAIISINQDLKNKVTLQIKITSNALLNYIETHTQHQKIITAIMRIYGGIFDALIAVDIDKIAQQAETKTETIINTLQALSTQDIIDLKMNQTEVQITYLKPREDDLIINRISKIIKQQNQLKVNQVQDVLNYINNINTCKSVQLLNYFGETNVTNCGICSVCISKKSSPIVDIETLKLEIIAILKTETYNSRALQEKLNCNTESLIQTLNLLLEQNIITISKANTYTLK